MNIHKKFFSKIGRNYLIYGLLALFFQFIIFNVVGSADANLFSNINVKTIAGAICNYILPLPVFIYFMKKLDSTKLPKQNINLKTLIAYISITFTLMVIGNIIGLTITSAIGTVIQNDVSNPIQNLINSTDIMLNLILISIIGPIFEEVIFRKILIDRTIKYGAKVSIILSAVLFAFFHGNLNQFFYALLIGGFFAYVYIKTGKIIYTILLHLIINFIGSVATLFVMQSANAIASGSQTSFDIGIVLIYLALMLLIFLIGLISMSRYKQAKFNGSKTEITLKKPLKTVFLNLGMILFMGFFTFEIIYQLFL